MRIKINLVGSDEGEEDYHLSEDDTPSEIYSFLFGPSPKNRNFSFIVSYFTNLALKHVLFLRFLFLGDRGSII